MGSHKPILGAQALQGQGSGGLAGPASESKAAEAGHVAGEVPGSPGLEE